MARKPKLTQEEQSKRFLEAAKEAGVEADEKTLERIVRKVAPNKKKSGKAGKPR